MRVLLTTRGSSGHVTPLAPFGHALVRAGHGVLVAAQHHFAANVERTGLVFAAVGAVREEDWMPLLPRLAQMRLDEGHDEMCSEFFGRLDMAAMLPGLREVAEDWRPDLIVRESWEYGSTIVAEERGIPLARVGLGVEGVERVSERAAIPAVDRERAAAGLAADPDGERLRAAPYLTDVPESLEDPAAPAPPRILRFRTGEAPEPSDPGGEPLVYVSFGSVTAGGHLPFYPALYQAAIEALAPLPARFLLTIGEDRDLAQLGPLPASVEVQRWVPQEDILHRAAAVVTTAATARRSARSPTACRSSCCPCSRSTSGSTPRRSRARAPGSRSTASVAPAARSTCPARRRSRACAPRSSTCSAIPRRARRRDDSPPRCTRCPLSTQRRPRSRPSLTASCSPDARRFTLYLG